MLELIELSRRFDQVVALDGLSFEVPEGHIVGFVGRNGSGKTTTMRMAGDLSAPLSGHQPGHSHQSDRGRQRYPL